MPFSSRPSLSQVYRIDKAPQNHGGKMETLKLGSTGEDVRVVQGLLRRVIDASHRDTDVDVNVEVDGVFGPVTENAVWFFQAALAPKGGITDLVVDKIVGPKTLAALEKVASALER